MKKLVILFLIFSVKLHAQEFLGDEKELDLIMEKAKSFSSFYVNGQYDDLASCYTVDGKIMPPGADVIEGRAKIKARWILPEGVTVTRHKTTPLELKIYDNVTHDIGYYEGTTLRADGSTSDWKGKYIIIWNNVDGQWLIEWDIWNRMP